MKVVSKIMESVKYKVLKAFEFTRDDEQKFSFEEGAEIDAQSIFTDEQLGGFIKDGSLELIVPEGDVYDGPMGQYKITGEAEYTDENGDPTGFLEVGSIQTLPEPIGEQFVADGVAEKVVENTTDNTTNSASLNPPTSGDVLPPKSFEGKEIVSDVTRDVNGKTYHHIRLLDGTTQDLTDEEYASKVS